MIIDCLSDLHGSYPKDLPGGDLLIIAGDLTASDLESEYFDFFDWLHDQPYRKKVFIGGNHDVRLQQEDYKGPVGVMEGAFDYLCDSGVEFEGMKIWGSPWQLKFRNQNPNCMAFSLESEEELCKKFDLIPKDTDILITHSPPFGILDREIWTNNRCGSEYLKSLLFDGDIKPNLHVFGHIHESYGVFESHLALPGIIFINASHMNEYYEPINKAIQIELKEIENEST